MPPSVWTQYLWRGGGGGRMVAWPAWGQLLQVRQTRVGGSGGGGGCISFFFDLRLTGEGSFCSAHCSSWPLLMAPEDSGLNFQHTSKGFPGCSSLQLYLNLFLLLFPVCFIYQKAETDGDGNDIVKLDRSLSKQTCRPARPPFSARENGIT